MSDNKLVVYNAETDLSLAKSYHKSGIFAGTPEQNLVKIHAGKALGIDPVTSLSNIHLVQGKITLGATVVGALIKRSGKYNYRVVEHTNEVCELIFYEYFDSKWAEMGTSRFTLEDAKLAGVLNKDVWKKFPRNMLIARAITNGARWYTPDVFGGPIYTPEELESGITEEVPSGPEILTWKAFVRKVKVTFGIESEEVANILKTKYEGYDASKAEEMFEYITERLSAIDGEFNTIEDDQGE